MDKFENLLFQSVVESWFFDKEIPPISKNKNKRAVEFIITPECSKDCGICYLQKHRDKLYPDEIVDNEAILTNLRSVLNYWVVNKKKVPLVDLFSGEIWGEQLGYDVLNTMLEFAREFKYTNGISIATNMDFLFTPNGQKWMEYFIDEFNSLGIRINISASIDGAYLDGVYRPQDSKYSIKIDYDQDYYDKIFEFQSKYRFGFHPMVYSKNCKYWCDNFDWYISMIKRYYPDSPNKTPMMLEVRDDNWTDEDLIYFKKFLSHVIDYHYKEVYKENIYAFTEFLTRIRDYRIFINNNVGIYHYDGKLNCTVQNELFIRLGDLAIVPCHRTSYPENVYGWIAFDGEKMVAKAYNFTLMRKVLGMIPKNDIEECKSCVYNRLCMKGCLGSQLETNGDMFKPCESVCKMQKAKIDFLVDKYTELGVYEAMNDFGELQEILKITNQFKKDRKQILGY